MNTYHKIQTVYKRDPDNKYKTLLFGVFSRPEFEYLKNNEWVFTEKVDGMNIRVMFDGESVTFGGKTDKAQLPSNLVTRLNEHFLSRLELFSEVFNETSVCFYGEGYGAGIQKGGIYRETQSFVLFDIKIGEWWLQRKDIEEIAARFEMDIVPIIGQGTLDDIITMTSLGFNSAWGNFMAEGIVARPATELRARNGQRIITKIKHKDFIGVGSDNG